MQYYLRRYFSESYLKGEILDPDSEFYFAIRGELPIGYLKVNFGPAQTELQDDTALEIERIYVLREFQGLKAGQALLRKALEIATQKGLDYIWFGVWEKNTKAITFYEKNGFESFDTHLFKLGGETQRDILMRRNLGSSRLVADQKP